MFRLTLPKDKPPKATPKPHPQSPSQSRPRWDNQAGQQDHGKHNRSTTAQSTHQLLKFEDLSFGGEGVARLESGKVVFVPGALPGDTARCEIIKDSGPFARGRLMEIITGSPDRIPPACPHAEQCGGCEFWGLPPLREWELKTGAALEAISRISQLEQLPQPVFHGPGSPERYRRRLKLAFGRNGTPGFRKAGSHSIVPISHCLVAQPCLLESAREITPLLGAIATGGELLLEADSRSTRVVALLEVPLRYSERSKEARQLLQHVREFMEGLTRSGSDSQKPTLGGIRLLSMADGKADRVGRGSGRNRSAGRSAGGSGGGLEIGAVGDVSFTIDVAGRRFSLEAGVFNQANDQANHILVERVLNHMNPQPDQHILDLYCGWGNFTYPIAATGAMVHAMELSPISIAAGRRNLQAALDHITFHQTDLEQGLPSPWLTQTQHSSPIQSVLLDPPRTGASRKLLDDLVQLRPEKIIYVSCDPPTMGRDAAILQAAGYTMTSLEMVDMFPRTHHTECLAVFSAADDYGDGVA